MPRPCKIASERRGDRITIRLSAEERAQVDLAARRAGRTFSQQVRHVLIAGRITRRRAAIWPPELTEQLRRIGVNLAQLLEVPDTRGHHAPVAALRARLGPRLEAAMDRELDLPDDADPGVRVVSPDRGRVYAVRLTDGQREVIVARAESVQLTLSAYARAMLTEGGIVVRDEVEVPLERLEDLKGLGEALNDQTRRANSRHEPPPGLGPVLDALAAYVERLPEVGSP